MIGWVTKSLFSYDINKAKIRFVNFEQVFSNCFTFGLKYRRLQVKKSPSCQVKTNNRVSRSKSIMKYIKCKKHANFLSLSWFIKSRTSWYSFHWKQFWCPTWFMLVYAYGYFLSWSAYQNMWPTCPRWVPRSLMQYDPDDTG